MSQIYKNFKFFIFHQNDPIMGFYAKNRLRTLKTLPWLELARTFASIHIHLPWIKRFQGSAVRAIDSLHRKPPIRLFWWKLKNLKIFEKITKFSFFESPYKTFRKITLPNILLRSTIWRRTRILGFGCQPSRALLLDDLHTAQV